MPSTKQDARSDSAGPGRAGLPHHGHSAAQFAGTQAAINVMTSQRYSVVTDEIIGYALGRWSGEAIEVMDSAIRACILDRSRARIWKSNLPAPRKS